jgi:hypothetical protein
LSEGEGDLELGGDMECIEKLIDGISERVKEQEG